jgi:hypothetical protein
VLCSGSPPSKKIPFLYLSPCSFATIEETNLGLVGYHGSHIQTLDISHGSRWWKYFLQDPSFHPSNELENLILIKIIRRNKNSPQTHLRFPKIHGSFDSAKGNKKPDTSGRFRRLPARFSEYPSIFRAAIFYVRGHTRHFIQSVTEFSIIDIFDWYLHVKKICHI